MNTKMLVFSDLAFKMPQQSATIVKMSIQTFYYYKSISGQEIGTFRSATATASLIRGMMKLQQKSEQAVWNLNQ